MSFTFENRLTDSPYIEGVARIQFEQDSAPLCSADGRWEIIVKRHHGRSSMLIAGPMTRAAIATHLEGTEFLVAKFKLGIYLPHLPAKRLLDVETVLPKASSESFSLNGTSWELPNFENFDTFVDRLVRNEAVVRDPVVDAALQNHSLDVAARTVQHRFLQVTGLTQTYIRQIERARQAAALLEQGVSILDTVYEAGYFDQPHLTRALNRFIGQTPAQIAKRNKSE